MEWREIGGYYIIDEDDRMFHRTAKGATPIATYGVDGMHLAILGIPGSPIDECPVAQICPMDSQAIWFVGSSIIDFLATSCNIEPEEVRKRIDDDASSFLSFIDEEFGAGVVYGEDRHAFLAENIEETFEIDWKE